MTGLESTPTLTIYLLAPAFGTLITAPLRDLRKKPYYPRHQHLVPTLEPHLRIFDFQESIDRLSSPGGIRCRRCLFHWIWSFSRRMVERYISRIASFDSTTQCCSWPDRWRIYYGLFDVAMDTLVYVNFTGHSRGGIDSNCGGKLMRLFSCTGERCGKKRYRRSTILR